MSPPETYWGLPNRQMYPDESYSATVYPTSHISCTDLLHVSGASLLRYPPFKGRVDPLPVNDKPLMTGYYSAHFTCLLSMSLDAELQRMKDATIPAVLLTFTPTAADSYQISIPGIREDAPKLSIGDRLVLRWMIDSLQTPSTSAFEVEVTGMNKSAGLVYVKSPHLEFMMAQLRQSPHGELKFQVRFLLSVDPFCAMQDAVRRLGFAVDHDHLAAMHWLLPESRHLQEGLVFGQGTNITHWCDPDLNAEQQVSAVCFSVIERNPADILRMLWSRLRTARIPFHTSSVVRQA